MAELKRLPVAGDSHSVANVIARAAFLAFMTLVAVPLQSPGEHRGTGTLFDVQAPLPVTIKAPFQQLFDKGIEDDRFTVPAEVTFQDGPAVAATLGVRGNTSKNEIECSFPKLKVKFDKERPPAGPLLAGFDSLKVGTHCGEARGEELSDKFGRLANERAPWREALVYRLVAISGVATLRTRTARITYIDTSPAGTIVPSTLTRNALLLEDDEDAVKRHGGTAEISADEFTTADTVFTVPDSARLAFAQAMIGNFDWCLAFTADDTYRCDQRRKLWNLLAVRRSDGTAFPLMKDFDLAGPVPGRHIWFEKVFNPAFAGGSVAGVEVLAQVQRTRTLFSRAVLDATRREFLEKRAAAYDAVERADVDPGGRTLARHYLDSFFKAIGSDAEFYRRVVTLPGVRLYTSADKTEERCQTGDTVPVGTPVNELRRAGGMAEVVVLDALWHWAPPQRCDAVQQGPIWIDAGAIGANYPSK